MGGAARAQQRLARRRRVRWLGVASGTGTLLALGGIVLLSADHEGEGGGLAPVSVSMSEYAYGPVEIQAEPGQELAVTNHGAIPHNLLILELAKGIELASGGRGTLALPDDATVGTYEVICDLPGHREAGMVGTLVVGSVVTP
jgi:plastocyanin